MDGQPAKGREGFTLKASRVCGVFQVDVDVMDSSLPLPVRGSFCGPVACYGSLPNFGMFAHGCTLFVFMLCLSFSFAMQLALHAVM